MNHPTPHRRSAVRLALTLACLVAFVLAAGTIGLAQSRDERSQRPQNIRETIDKAIEALKAGDVPQAIVLFESVRDKQGLASARPPVELLLADGDHHFAQGTPEEIEIALQVFSLALEIHGKNLDSAQAALIRARRSEALGAQHRIDAARAEIDTIRKSHGENPRALLTADLAEADLMLVQGLAGPARDKLAALAESDDPAIASSALFSLGRAHIQLKAPEEAIGTFRKLVNRYGESDAVKRAVFLSGQIYQTRGDFLEARRLYEAASAIGAIMQITVTPGNDLVVKIDDPDNFARTRSRVLKATLTAPSGDKETLRLEKNDVSDRLFVGRIRTIHGEASAEDGVLQVAGGDAISITYPGIRGEPFKVRVVDDGRINIDASPMPDPPRRGERVMQPAQVGERPRRQREQAMTIRAERAPRESLSPGNPAFVQVVDVDLDATNGVDTTEAEVFVRPFKGYGPQSVKVKLTETGPRTGVFTGAARTTPPTAFATASSEAPDHPARFAMDADRDTPAPPALVNASQPAPKADAPSLPATYWQPQKGDAEPWIEIDLRQPVPLGKLRLTTAAGRKPSPAIQVMLRGDNVDRTVAVKDINGATAEADLGGAFAKIIHIAFPPGESEGLALAGIVVTDTTGRQLIPTGIDPTAPERRELLEFDAGQSLVARYTDEVNETPGKSIARESRPLGVRYNDATIQFGRRGPSQNNTSETTIYPAWRLSPEGEYVVVVTDADADTTPQPDHVSVDVFTEAGDRQTLELTETGGSTGVFAAALPLAANSEASQNPRLLYFPPDCVIWASYLDERNMNPGYRTFRYARAVSNDAMAGGFATRPMRTTAWPYDVKIDDDGESRVITRALGKGRIALDALDPDQLPDGGRTMGVALHSLLGGPSAELVFHASGPDHASHLLDLILGDPESGMREDTDKQRRAGATELDLPGDDILRVAYKDERVTGRDIAFRAVAEPAAVTMKGQVDKLFEALDSKPGRDAKADEPAVVPVIRLKNADLRFREQQDARLAELKGELNARFKHYSDAKARFEKRRSAIQAQLAKLAPATQPAVGAATRPAAQNTKDASAADTSDAAEASIRLTLEATEHQVSALAARIDRLKALGAANAPPGATNRAPEDLVIKESDKLIINGPLVPGRAFNVVIEDPQTRADAIEVRVRSFAGRLIDTMKVKAGRQRDGTFVARIATERGDEHKRIDKLAIVPGGEVMADFTPDHPPAATPSERFDYIALASDAHVELMNSTYTEPVSEMSLGGPLYIQIIDYDADLSPELDRVLVTVTSDIGDSVEVLCSETEPHKGVFRGRLITDYGKPNHNDDVLQANYGGVITIAYHDAIREHAESPATISATLKIAGGSVGSIEGFSRQFGDSQEELQLWYVTGQAAYQVGRRLYLAGAHARAEEYLVESSDYFTQLISRAPTDPLAASSNYFLGNIQMLRGNAREAMTRYQEVIARWPKSEYVARSRFKLGQCFESMGQFDRAADSYVLLAYHHAEDPLVPSAMIRIMNHFARQKRWLDAYAVAERFTVRFPRHEQAGAAALKAGQWLIAAEKVDDALTWFASAQKAFATNDKAMAGLLYWQAATLLQHRRGGRDSQDKVRELLNRVAYDYPRSEYAELARLALEQLNTR